MRSGVKKQKAGSCHTFICVYFSSRPDFSGKRTGEEPGASKCYILLAMHFWKRVERWRMGVIFSFVLFKVHSESTQNLSERIIVWLFEDQGLGFVFTKWRSKDWKEILRLQQCSNVVLDT